MKNRKRNERRNPVIYFAKSSRAGRQDLGTRIPQLAGLIDKKVTIIGLGCLGAPSVLEFARCGVGELRIIDFDRVEAGTIVRWPFGMQSIGRLKTEIIENFLKENYPFSEVISFQHRIGEVRESEGQRSDNDVLDAALEETDLVYDASAELGVQYLLSSLSSERSIPYISISTTFGAWGGRLVRIRPKKTEGCWVCSRHRIKDGSLPSPIADPKGEFQPVGCANPTFTGTGFDTGIIALGGVRLAISTLTEDEQVGYPRFDWDVGIISLRDEKGNAITPSYCTFELKKHPLCQCAR